MPTTRNIAHREIKQDLWWYDYNTGQQDKVKNITGLGPPRSLW